MSAWNIHQDSESSHLARLVWDDNFSGFARKQTKLGHQIEAMRPTLVCSMDLGWTMEMNLSDPNESYYSLSFTVMLGPPMLALVWLGVASKPSDGKTKFSFSRSRWHLASGRVYLTSSRRIVDGFGLQASSWQIPGLGTRRSAWKNEAKWLESAAEVFRPKWSTAERGRARGDVTQTGSRLSLSSQIWRRHVGCSVPKFGH